MQRIHTLLILLLGFFATGAAAQSVRGRILVAGSLTGVGGSPVSVLDSAGSVVARVMSGSDGSYQLKLPGPGRFELRVLRIGFRPTRLVLPNIGENETFATNMILSAELVQLTSVQISGRDNCGVHRPDADLFLGSWERARGALASARLSDQASALDVRVLRVDGTVDRPGTIVRGREFDAANRHLVMDSVKARETITGALFASTPAETLAAGGYVRRRADGSVLFDAPSADALLSDMFLERHCFGIEPAPREHPNWIGIRFRPIRTVDSLADIEGTMWLNQANAELRQLDFNYTNLQYLPLEICSAEGQHCYGSSNSLGTGGSMAFAYLPSGEWFVSRWSVRTPAEEFQRRFSGVKVRTDQRSSDACYRGPNCEQLVIPMARLGVNSGAIASVARQGAEVWRNDITIAALSRVASMQAAPTKSAKSPAKGPAHVSGVIADANGLPLPRVVVSTDAPVRATVTNDSGYFEIRTLPAKSVNLSVRKAGYGPISFSLSLLSDSTRHVQLTLVTAPPVRPK